MKLFLIRKHTPATCICAFLFACTSAPEVRALDLNGDGVDDLYAERYSAVGLEASSDLDGDGFTLLQESIFRTDPWDPQDWQRIAIEDGILGKRLFCPSKEGVRYAMEWSADLGAWQQWRSWQFGTGGQLEFDAGSGAEGFLRLVGQPIDSDADGLLDLDEERLGTDPNQSDSDGDLLPDGFEITNDGFDPTMADPPDGDANSNGVPDLEDYASSLGPVIVWTGDAGNGQWHDTGNWEGGMLPGSEDVVLVPAMDTTITVSGETPASTQAIFGEGVSLVVDDGSLDLAEIAVVESIDLTNGGMIGGGGSGSSSAIRLVVSGDVSIGVSSRIDLDGAGSPPDTGLGAPPPTSQIGAALAGASHGGRGGLGFIVHESLFGRCYGSVFQPLTTGSGSERAAGGAAVRLVVGGTLSVDGEITADGAVPSAAGGSLWIECGTLSGAGTLTAEGADGFIRFDGAGGGGRIAVYYDASNFTGSYSAVGGTATTDRYIGGAGSIYTRERSAPLGNLVYDNAGRIPTVGMSTVEPAVLTEPLNLTVSGGARITALPGVPIVISTAGMVTIDELSVIDLTGLGYGLHSGPGAPPEPKRYPIDVSAGASHAGRGAVGWLVSENDQGDVYGDFRAPIELGSGALSHGGGALRVISSALHVDGEILVDGAPTGSVESSGSGGSLWVTTTTFSGSGLLSANGGYKSRVNAQLGGGGSGGRIAVYADDVTFDGALSATSPMVKAGAAGTVFTEYAGIDSLTIDNGPDVATFETILPQTLELEGTFRLLSNSIAGYTRGDTNYSANIIVSSGIEIGEGASLRFDNRPLGAQLEFGCFSFGDEPPITTCGGFGHGGSGAVALGGCPGGEPDFDVSVYGLGVPYGSLYAPRLPGSGGKAGGAIALKTEGTFLLEGTIDVSAGHIVFPDSGAGSSAGSVLVEADTIAGAGQILAAGGGGRDFSFRLRYGGGGGGRVALYAREMSDTITFDLSPGTTSTSGGGGTLFRRLLPSLPATGAIREIAHPHDLRPGALESDTEIFVFLTHRSYDLCGTLIPIEASAAGTYDAPEDLVVDSVLSTPMSCWLLHADPTDGQSPVLEATVTFPAPVLGVIATEAGITTTRRPLGAPEHRTDPMPHRATGGLELDGGDRFTLSADLRTLTVRFDTTDGIDQLRVLTAVLN